MSGVSVRYDSSRIWYGGGWVLDEPGVSTLESVLFDFKNQTFEPGPKLPHHELKWTGVIGAKMVKLDSETFLLCGGNHLGGKVFIPSFSMSSTKPLNRGHFQLSQKSAGNTTLRPENSAQRSQ